MEEKLYQLTAAQDVCILQCKYTLFKHVINILTSATADKEIDLDLMRKAWNLEIERNDSLRIRFVKQGKELMQKFIEPYAMDVPYIEFGSQEEQEQYFLKDRELALKWKKNETFKVVFAKTYDGKFMIILKVSHPILDSYGLFNLYKDLFEVYDALKESIELPPAPAKFEDVVKKDVLLKNNIQFREENEKYFKDLLASRPEPSYVGIHGSQEPHYKKAMKNNKYKAMKMFFFNNRTNSDLLPISSDVISKALKYCEGNNCSLATFMMYVYHLVAAILCDNVENVVTLELCNCRGTLSEKKTCGDKAQSLGCPMHFDYSKSFKENLDEFVAQQNISYRHVGFEDTKFEMLLNKFYKKSLLSTYYPCTFSLIPVSTIKDVNIQIHSNGRFVLPAYVAVMWDVNTNGAKMAYDCQKAITSAEAIKSFHSNYVSAMEQVIDNSSILLKDVIIK